MFWRFIQISSAWLNICSTFLLKVLCTLKVDKLVTFCRFASSVQLCTEPGEQRTREFITFTPSETGSARIPETPQVFATTIKVDVK